MQPPRWALRFFRWYCNDHLSDAALGDMLELYERRCMTMRKWKADLLFIWNVLLFLQPFALRKRSRSIHINQIDMFQNYFKIAVRTMSRQKMYTAIKIGGFALGLATCFVIALFIRNELSMDKYYTGGENIYRLLNFYTKENEKWTAFPAPVAQILRTEFPEVESAGRLIPYNWFQAAPGQMRRDDQVDNSYEDGFAYADPELIDILQIPLIYGNPKKALVGPKTIVISKRKADKYFPNEDPVGKVLILNEDKENGAFTVSGVMKDFRTESHIKFDFLLTLSGVEFWKGEQTSWCCWNYNPYVRLRPGTDPVALEKKLLKIRDTHYVGYLKESQNQSVGDVLKYHEFRLQPVGDIYLKSDGVGDIIPHGDMRYIWIFGGVACFILLLACINFINLSTAKSANRAKEVGLRKVVGSHRGYIIRQFLTESILFSFISFALGIALVLATLPYFNYLTEKTLEIPWTTWWLYPALVLGAVLVGILAGVYPSFYLSSFKPVDVLKGAISRGARNSKMRSAMVVFQFTTSIVLIIGTFVIYRQMNFILNAKVGFDKEQVMMIQGVNTMGDKQKTFKEELIKLKEVENATTTNYMPVNGTKRDQNGFWNEGKEKIDQSTGAQHWFVDEDYLSTLGIKLTEGRNFDPDIKSDSSAIIINQSMAKALGLKEPLGKRISNWELHTIIGVVEDFHFEDMKGKIDPLSFSLGSWGSIMPTKVNGKDMAGAIKSVGDLWDKFMPHQPFRYTFLDESYERMYEDVQRMGNIFAGFAILAVIVACLGLFALSAFMVEQRNKEISIRLVLGATVNSIFGLLTRNFLLLVLISFAIAAPLGWYMMSLWLRDYEYKTDITWDIFILSGCISVLIALLTISYQSIRAALANPAQGLRSE